MKLAWSLAAMGVGLALGLSPARADNEFLAPVVKVMNEGGATPAAAAAAPTVNCIDGGCNTGCATGNQSNSCCTVYTPQMIGSDLPSNIYAGTFFANQFVAGYGLLPQVQRGSFKVADNESPAPADRFFVTYSYYNNVRAPATQFGILGFQNGLPVIGLVNRQVSTDVHRQTFGFEKTFLGGDASIGIRMNAIQQDGDIQDDEFGDTTIIGKYALINREDLLISIGIAVTAPTGTANAGALGAPYRSVLIQPYSGFIWNRDRLFVQGFNSIITSTDSRDPNFGTYDIGLGYRLYQGNNCKDGWLTYVIPTAEAHANLPTTKEGWANRVDYALPDSLITTLGVHFGLCGKANLTIGAGCPVSGPKLYDVSGLAQLNWRF